MTHKSAIIDRSLRITDGEEKRKSEQDSRKSTKVNGWFSGQVTVGEGREGSRKREGEEKTREGTRSGL